MTVTIGWVVHYREHDAQGGYWPMSPKGPYKTRRKAQQAAFILQNPRSPFTDRRYLTDNVRDVRVKLRIEIG